MLRNPWRHLVAMRTVIASLQIRESPMFTRPRFAALLVVGASVVLGYAVAAGGPNPAAQPDDKKAAAPEKGPKPGDPGYTRSLDGRYLPNPPPKFGGVINLSAKDSKPYWPPKVVPPKGAPNILLIMTDDQGYGVSGTFGGVVPTPAMDRVAKAGLRYTQFCSTALCSPTRAALITGRNHHSVGFGIISEQSTGFPGYNSVIGPENATCGEILKQNGFATSWFGKNHNTPS